MNLRRMFLLTVLAATVVTGLYGLSTADDDDKDQEKEIAVSLKDVPDAVKATMLAELLRGVKGLELEEIERDTENGKVVYEAEFEYGDTEIELEIDANGKLLITSRDSEPLLATYDKVTNTVSVVAIVRQLCRCGCGCPHS